MADSQERGSPLQFKQVGPFSIPLYHGQELYPSSHLKSHIEKRVSLFPQKEMCLYLVPSPLMGYGLPELVEHIPESASILTVEVDENLHQLTENHLSCSLKSSSKVKSIQFSSFEALYTLLKEIGFYRFKKCLLTPLNRGYMLHKTLYDSLAKSVECAIADYWKNRFTTINMGHLWISNLFKNFALLEKAKPLTSIKLKGSVLIAGAGLSLESALPFMKRNRHNFTLIAVDTAIPFLIKSGITPDFIFVLEAQSLNTLDLYPVKNSKIPIIADVTAHPSTFKIVKGDIYFYISQFAEIDLIKDVAERLSTPLSPPLGSVGVAALYHTLRVSDGPILTAGLDFYTVWGKSHARESPHEFLYHNRTTRLDSSYLIQQNAQKLQTGREIPPRLTSPNLKQYKLLFEEIAHSAPHRVFDLNSHSIVERVSPISFKDAEAITEKFPSSITISNVPPREVAPLVREKRDLLLSLIKVWNEEAESGTGEKLLPLLEKNSFLYFHFPDYPPFPSQPDPVFFVRAVKNAEKYKTLITRNFG